MASGGMAVLIAAKSTPGRVSNPSDILPQDTDWPPKRGKSLIGINEAAGTRGGIPGVAFNGQA